MSDTHPNAFRAEATEKRTQGMQLINEAEALEARAVELEGGDVPELPPKVAPPPASGATYTPEDSNKDSNKSSK